MASDTSIRQKIHGVWESFFPSTVYFILFVAIALFSFGFEHAEQLARAGYFDDYTNNKFYKLLNNFELLKLVPIVAVFTLAFVVYAFDQIAMMVGNALPPFPVWTGSSALYVEEHYLHELWRLLPDENNVAALDYQGRRIVEQAKLDEKSLPANSFAWLQERQNKAGRMAAYAKAGIVWSVLIYVVAFCTGFLSLRSTAVFVGGLLGFVLLFILALIRQTYVLILNGQEYIRVAAMLIRLQNKSIEIDHSRVDSFDKQLDNSIRYAKRFVGLDWRPRVRASGLINAFFGFGKKSAPSKMPR